MSVSYIPDRVKYCLWGKAGGRCQYGGCNLPLFRDEVTQFEFNTGYIAHIIADKPDGPRGHPTLSEALKQDINNLMLLCDAHHRLVDKVDVPGHPVEKLQDMKRRHEVRIDILASISDERHSQILLYGAKIGQHDSHLSFQKGAAAMVPDRYPASSSAIEIGLKASAFGDAEPSYWEMEIGQLRRQFATLVKPRFAGGEVSHLSVFALAPIPLLIELGRLLSDIPAADVFQLHREPPDWKWRPEPRIFEFRLDSPGDTSPKAVALILALSAHIVPERVEAVLGNGAAIWTLTHAEPSNDFLQSAVQLREFRRAMRDTFDRIKAVHGEDASLHLFPAAPVSAAVEIGRTWMPKADLPFCIYDQNRSTGGFTRVLEIQ